MRDGNCGFEVVHSVSVVQCATTSAYDTYLQRLTALGGERRTAVRHVIETN